MTEAQFDLNPYRPGAGIQPPEMAGRLAELAYFDGLVIEAKRRQVHRGMVMWGLRGVGKTVLLNRLQQLAEFHSWICVGIEGQTNNDASLNLRRRFAAQITTALLSFQARRRIAKGLASLFDMVTSFTMAAGPVTVGVERARAGTGLLDVDVQDLVLAIAEEAKKRECGFGLFIDEMQDLDRDLLSALLVAQHAAQQRELPFYLIGAGLPSLPAVLADTRSYAERLFRYSDIGPLNQQEAESALVAPAARYQRSFEDGAVTKLLEASGGYPYFIQELGWAMWSVTDGRVFTEADAEAATQVANARLDSGFFSSRWLRASERERAYMRSIADSGEDEPRTTDVADRLGQSLTELSTTRSSLIKKGLIYAPERGRIAFTVPGMAAYIARHPDDPTP